MDHRSYLDPANQAVTNSHKRKMESTPTWGYSAAPTTTPTTTTPTTATAHPSAKKRPRTSANPPASHSNTTPSLPLGGETLVGSEAQKNGGTEEEIDLERWDLPAILNLPSVEDFEKSNTLPEISSLRTLSNCPERARELIQQRALETKVESIARQHNLRLEGFDHFFFLQFLFSHTNLWFLCLFFFFSQEKSFF